MLHSPSPGEIDHITFQVSGNSGWTPLCSFYSTPFLSTPSGFMGKSAADEYPVIARANRTRLQTQRKSSHDSLYSVHTAISPSATHRRAWKPPSGSFCATVSNFLALQVTRHQWSSDSNNAPLHSKTLCHSPPRFEAPATPS